MADELATGGDAVVQRLSVAWLPSAQLVDDRGAIEPDVLVADQAVPELEEMQDAEADAPPVPGRRGSEPMTVPVINCSPLLLECPAPDLPRTTLAVVRSDQGARGLPMALSSAAPPPGEISVAHY